MALIEKKVGRIKYQQKEKAEKNLQNKRSTGKKSNKTKKQTNE